MSKENNILSYLTKEQVDFLRCGYWVTTGKDNFTVLNGMWVQLHITDDGSALVDVPGGSQVPDRYPMCKDQVAQIDCRVSNCKYHQNAKCTNLSPAITLAGTGKVTTSSFTCWSFKSK